MLVCFVLLGSQPTARASDFGVLVEPSLVLGAAKWSERSVYTDTDTGAPKSTYDRHPYVGFGSEFGLALGAYLGDHVQLAGYARIGLAGHPEGFRVRPAHAGALGLQLTLSQHADRGVYATLRGGLALMQEHHGFSAGMELGYAWQVADAWYLGLGLASALEQVDYREDGDWGFYDIRSRLIAGGVSLRVRYREP
ncbi:MAG: hypothetical protein QM778_21430 [Myxococcales bacterium]